MDIRHSGVGPDRTDEIRWRVAAGERDALRPAGDLMQSASSRLLEWVIAEVGMGAMPYEVHMAALECRQGIDNWTEARRTNWPKIVRHQIEVEDVG